MRRIVVLGDGEGLTVREYQVMLLKAKLGCVRFRPYLQYLVSEPELFNVGTQSAGSDYLTRKEF